MMTALAPFLAVVASLACIADGGVDTWPPPGPNWVTDPAEAFERSRKERKPVLVYIGTEG